MKAYEQFLSSSFFFFGKARFRLTADVIGFHILKIVLLFKEHISYTRF